MIVKDAYTHDGIYAPRVEFDAPLFVPYAPADNETVPLTDENLAAFAKGGYMPVSIQRVVAAELLAARKELALRRALNSIAEKVKAKAAEAGR